MSLQDVLQDVQRSYEFRKTATVKGISYELQVLSVDDERKTNAALDVLSNEEDTQAYFKELRKEILSRSIVVIKGEPVPSVVEIEGRKVDRAIYLKDFLGTLPDTLIDRLFDIYIDLREESEKGIESEMQYDWFKTPEQRKKEYEDQLEKVEKETDSSKGSESAEDKEEALEEDLEEFSFRKVNETAQDVPPPKNEIL